MSDLDSQYLQLYRNFSKALRDLDEARKRMHAYKAKKAARDFLYPLKQFLSDPLHRKKRRPVGSPKDYSIPSEVRRQAPVVKKERTPIYIYMGPILGMQTLWPTSGPLPIPDHIDMDEVEDYVENKHFDTAYANYWRHKRAFFNFVNNKLLNKIRSERIKKYISLAKEESEYQAMLQMLGSDSDASEQLKPLIQKACENMYAIYKNTPKIKESDPSNPNRFFETEMPESMEVVLQIFNVSTKAQEVGLDTGAAKSLHEVIDQSIMPDLWKYHKEELISQLQKECSNMLSLYENAIKLKVPNPNDSNQLVEPNIPERKGVVDQMLAVYVRACKRGLKTGAAKSLIDLINTIKPNLIKYKHLMK